jgi:hypothetical protein
MHPQPLESVNLGLVLSVISSAMNGALAWSMLRKARSARSAALEADARHLFTDVWTSAGVVLGLLAVQATGWLMAGPGDRHRRGAEHHARRRALIGGSADGLMDHALEPEARAQIDQVLADFGHQTIRFDHVVTRRAGQRRFVDLHMHMPAGWTLGRAAAVRASVEQALMSRRAGPARHDPAAAAGRGGALRGQPGPAVIALVQRVAEARVEVAGAVTGAIGPGLLVLMCAEPADGRPR